MTQDENAVQIPYTELQAETVRNLAEEFVTRDGTDYGEVEKTLGEKVEMLMAQLESGEAKIYFDADTETINIVASRMIR